MRASGSVVVAALLGVAGCSVAVADEGDRIGSTGEPVLRGDVAVQRVVSVADGREEPEVVARVSARFLQVSPGLDDGWVAMLVDGDRALPGLGTCSRPSPAPRAELPAASPSSSIELLDVGDVLIHAGSSTMLLAARAFPDVGDLVSGVVYTSRDAHGELPAEAPFLLETTGSPFVQGFRLALDPPGELLDVVLDGEALRGGAPEVAATDEMQLTWTIEQARGDNDRILVELAPVPTPDAAASPPLRCLFPDAGEARLPALEPLVGPLGDAVDVTVHRLRRVVALLPEIDETAVEFDFAVTARLPVGTAR